MRAAGVEGADFPDDPAALRAPLSAALTRCDALGAERDGVAAERDALAERNERLQRLLGKLRRTRFGKESERLPEEQPPPAFGEVEASIAEAAAEAGKTSPEEREGASRRRRAGRGRPPAHLPRVEVALSPEDTDRPRCRGAMAEVGSDASERLDVIPARFRALVTRRPKLACRACPGVVLQTPAPPRLVEGGTPTEATVAHVLVSRRADHLPPHRQARILARRGIATGREVLADWTGTAAHEVAPVVRRMHGILLASPRLFAGETTVPVLDPGRGRTKKGHARAIARDDRPWGGTDPPAVVFRYAPGRGAEHARALLRGCGGVLRCDGHGVHKAIAAEGGMTPASCWSHARREFVPLARGKAAPVATGALRRIALLHAVEAEVRGGPSEVRRAVRRQKGRPIALDLLAWPREALARLPGSSPAAEAIRYAPNRRDGPVRFLDDGRIEVDDNAVERAIRPLRLSRKNALFASGDDGGVRWAAVASLVGTCKLNAVDPQRHFADLLTRLVGGRHNSRIDGLMPWRWASTAEG